MKQAGSLLELAMLGKDHGKANELDTFFVIASSLWRRRNKRIFADLEEEPRTTIEWTLSSHKLYSECLKIPTQELLNVSCWKPLDQGSLKLNIDGIIFADLQAAGIGAILWNHEGEVLMLASLKESSIQYSEMIESLAILMGI